MSSSTTNEVTKVIFTFEDLSDVLTRISQLGFAGFNNLIDIEFIDISMKTKLIVRPDIRASRFDEKSFFSTILSFAPHCDYKHYNEYISQKILKTYHRKIFYEIWLY